MSTSPSTLPADVCKINMHIVTIIEISGFDYPIPPLPSFVCTPILPSRELLYLSNTPKISPNGSEMAEIFHFLCCTHAVHIARYEKIAVKSVGYSNLDRFTPDFVRRWIYTTYTHARTCTGKDSTWTGCICGTT